MLEFFEVIISMDMGSSVDASRVLVFLITFCIEKNRLSWQKKID